MEGTINVLVDEKTGFGTFLVRKRYTHIGRNPQTGETMKITTRNAPVFKASKKFKKIVN
ncbi:HU family DNA-binding protein [Enterococcus avium]|uniref:HU family DNA-binding protein n=1 Tax=Enterococcus avium TaxID=33945 RepID=UPI0030EF851A